SADGLHVFVRSLRDTEDEPFVVCAVNFAISFGLLKIGIDQLHATVIAADGKAFGFLGFSGWGKSTLASTFLDSGYSILTDDMLVTKHVGNALFPFPGPSHLKLYETVARFVTSHHTDRPTINAVSDKLIIPLYREPSTEEAAPLKAFYVLNSP